MTSSVPSTSRPRGSQETKRLSGRPRVGLLALQGDSAAHGAVFDRIGAETRRVRLPADLTGVDALVLPGGESTTMLHLLARNHLEGPLAEAVIRLPVFATCAGLILLAASVAGPKQRSLGVIDVDVERNGWGRQISSFIDEVRVTGWDEPLEAVFIRAPRITRVGAAVEVLAEVRGEPCLVRQGLTLAATFHPELTDDDRLASSFLSTLRARAS